MGQFTQLLNDVDWVKTLEAKVIELEPQLKARADAAATVKGAVKAYMQRSPIRVKTKPETE